MIAESESVLGGTCCAKDCFRQRSEMATGFILTLLALFTREFS
jgi:hypothetical protein